MSYWDMKHHPEFVKERAKQMEKQFEQSYWAQVKEDDEEDYEDDDDDYLDDDEDDDDEDE